MGKIWVEVCLISARGLRRTSSLFKLQWYAVGWIDPKNKYCTKINSCGNTNPVWKMKFSALVDDSKINFGNLEVQVEVYSRDSIFLRENLQGTAIIVLKEFLDKFVKISDGFKLVEEIGSFQLRKRNSSKPEGFVDVSIRKNIDTRNCKLEMQGLYNVYSSKLVGFGRAVSDCGLTASIYVVMVLPPLQGMGIGQMIVKRILRVLTSRGIYDISALCSKEERFFFTACGFGNDILESTTMIYTRTASPGEEVHRVGRKQLLVPPDKKIL